MILQALAQYYQRISQDNSSGIAPEGFARKPIAFIIVLDRTGVFKGLEPTRFRDGKREVARSFIVPKMDTRSSNIAANLLWDNPEYVLGHPKTGAGKDQKEFRERARNRHKNFIARVKETFPSPIADEGVSAVVRFLDANDFSAVFEDRLWEEIEKSGANISFKLEGDTGLVCQREAVRMSIESQEGRREGDSQMQCLVTGELDTPARKHTPIMGVWDAKPQGAHIVSFNLPAFWSFHKTQGFTAPVGKKTEHAYTTALNTLLARGSRQRMQVGDASTVFWAEKPHEIEESFSSFFGLMPSGESIQDTEAIRALYRAPETGTPPLENDGTRFYVLGLSPNVSRLSVRFWYQGTVGEVRAHVKRHFDDCNMVHRDGEPEHFSLHALLASTAPPKRKGDTKNNVQPNLAGDVMMSILAGTPYPATLLSSVVRRIKAEQAAKTKAGRPQPNVTYQRASLIKACLVRNSRYYRKNEKEVGMKLDPENTNVGYRLGRLFSVLEKIQEEANPGINATIRDRFYGAASSTPVTGFFVPLKLRIHHLAKLRLEKPGLYVIRDRLIGQIMDGIEDFPSHLSLQDQGRFAVGYYHQRQSLFTKKTAAKEE